LAAKLRATSHDLPVMSWYVLLIGLLFLILLSRLFFLQVVTGTRLKLASLDNIIRSVRTAPPRGDIFDRAGRQLAKSANVYSLLYMVPDDIDDYFLKPQEMQLYTSVSPEQLQALSGIDAPQLGALKELIREQYAALQKQLAAEQGLPRKLDDKQQALVDSLAAQHIAELGPLVAASLPASKSLTQGKHALTHAEQALLLSLSPQQLLLLSNLSGAPAELHPDILAMAVSQRNQPYLNRRSGKALREIVRLAAYFGVPYQQLMQRIGAERKRVLGFQPITLVDELTQDQVVYLGENEADFSGILIEKYGFKRLYPLGNLAAHLTGYVGLVTEADPQSIKELGYGPREQVGKEGAERAFEQLLHGSGGHRDLEVNRERICLDVVREVPPKKGNSVYLTIDKEIQAKAQSVLGSRPGAAIVVNLQKGHEGEIMALASSPAFDPNRFNETKYFASLLSNNDLPLLNRAYRHAFPPGSTFKLVTATAALQTGRFTPGSGFYCPGKKAIGNRDFKCHNLAGHGGVSFLEAIAKSCDVAFYCIGLGLNDPPQTIKRFAEYFGYGSPTGIELPGEVSGTLPDERWKREHYAKLGYGAVDQTWYDGDTANYAIGQGFLTATPLQVLWSTTLVALDGKWYPPRLLYAHEVDTKVIPEPEARPSRRPLDPQALKEVKEGMRLAVTGGTCVKLGLEGMQICAKTGTAETGKRGETPHAWVCGFYPMHEPKYAFVVFFQNGGSGSGTAIPPARELLMFMRGYTPPKEKGN